MLVWGLIVSFDWICKMIKIQFSRVTIVFFPNCDVENSDNASSFSAIKGVFLVFRDKIFTIYYLFNQGDNSHGITREEEWPLEMLSLKEKVHFLPLQHTLLRVPKQITSN